MFESLSALPSARFEFCYYDPLAEKVTVSGSIPDLASTLHKHITDMTKKTSKKFSANFNISAYVSRNDIGKSLVQLARTLQLIHDKGEVHCDINPSNTLVLKDGTKPIDPLRIKTGQIAYAGTPGWAAPDQILRKPVSPATDIYPLGLMLIQVLSGAIYGEEKTFIIPTNVDKNHRIRCVADAEVLISDIDLGQGANEWKAFVESCIKFDPRQRPQDGKEFALQLEHLLKTYPLPGELKVKGFLGSLTTVDGATVRVLDDHRTR